MTSSLTVYRASAGSGKTFTLAAQYIKLLLTGDRPDAFRQTLAVTFTNKATAEMKDRIMQQLFGIWKGLPQSAPYLDTVRQELAADGIEAGEAMLRARAGAALVAILHDYNRFRVETIDSFFQSVTKNLAHELSLTANLQVDLDDTQALSNAVDHIMERLHTEPKLRSWVLSYIRERIDGDQGWRVSNEIKRFAKSIFLEKYLQESDTLPEKIGDSAFVNSYRTELNALKTAATEAMHEAVSSFRALLEQHGLCCKQFSNGQDLDGFLQKLEADDFAKTPGNRLLGYMETAEKWLKKADQKDTALLGLIAETFVPALAKLEQLRQTSAQTVNSVTLTLQHLNPLRLLNVIDREVTELTNEANRFLLAKTPILLNELIGESDAPFIFEKMGTLFRHVMIDEFQDTSAMQWKNFKSLLQETMSTGGGNLLVGDIKQSIYRWRGGDWSILGNIGREIDPRRIAIRNLDTNRRSERRIINFNNLFFAAAARALDALESETADTLQTAYADVVQKCPESKPDTGFVDITLYHKKNGDEWQDEMLADLKTRIETLHEGGLPYAEMAILVRKKSYIQPLVDFFATEMPNVRLVSDEAFLLSSSVAVQMLVAALRLLADKDSTVERAFLTEHYQNDILKKNATWNDFLLDKTVSLLPEAFTEKLSELRLMPLYELQEELINIFQLETLDGQEAYLFAYLDHVLQFSKDNTPNIADFLTFWDDKLASTSIPGGAVEGIRIFTIHKSKGLQFHTVLMPFCHWEVERDRNDGLLWCSPDDAPYSRLPLVPVSTNTQTPQSIYAKEYAEEHLQRRVDNLNLLYVAFTRAEKNLFVWGKSTDGLTGKSDNVADLIAAALPADLNEATLAEPTENEEELPVRFIYGTPILSIKKTEKTPASANRLEPIFETVSVPMQSFANTIEFKQSNRSKAFIKGDEADDTSEAYIQQGKLLHRLFSAIRTEADVEPMLRTFEAEGLVGSHLSTDSLRKLVQRGLRTPQVAEWFAPQWTVSNECAIVRIDPQTNELVSRRPDRVLSSDTDIIVIDFKFGRPRPEYRQQVQEYMALLAQMQPQKRVQGFLWYVYGNEVEQVS